MPALIHQHKWNIWTEGNCCFIEPFLRKIVLVLEDLKFKDVPIFFSFRSPNLAQKWNLQYWNRIRWKGSSVFSQMVWFITIWRLHSFRIFHLNIWLFCWGSWNNRHWLCLQLWSKDCLWEGIVKILLFETDDSNCWILGGIPICSQLW